MIPDTAEDCLVWAHVASGCGGGPGSGTRAAAGRVPAHHNLLRITGNLAMDITSQLRQLAETLRDSTGCLSSNSVLCLQAATALESQAIQLETSANQLEELQKRLKDARAIYRALERLADAAERIADRT